MAALGGSPAGLMEGSMLAWALQGAGHLHGVDH